MRTQSELGRAIEEAREQTDALFAAVRPDSFYERPIPERHRIVFYLGHVEAFDWNLIGRYALDRRPFHAGVSRRREQLVVAAAAEVGLPASTTLSALADAAQDEARPLRPDELEKGGGGGTATGSIGNTRPTGEDAARPLPPSQMGTGGKNMLDAFFSSIGPQRPESAPFNGEPPRTSMTAPPTGYQTPSPGQVYGISPTKELPKASTVESRMEGTK